MLVSALAMLAVGLALHARGASAAWAARLPGFGSDSRVAAVAGAGASGGEVSAPEAGAPEAGAPEAGAPDWEADPESEYRERYLKKGEQRRLIVALVFLGVVILILMIWWTWGKIHHRRPRL